MDTRVIEHDANLSEAAVSKSVLLGGRILYSTTSLVPRRRHLYVLRSTHIIGHGRGVGLFLASPMRVLHDASVPHANVLGSTT